jgi:hypothetical protein
VARIVVIALAALTVALVGALAWGAWRGGDDASVDELPSVAEVIAAQAHRHGVQLPELDDADRARLEAPAVPGSSLSPYDQVLSQLVAVRDAAGIDEAVAILGEVAIASDAVAADCPRLYAALTQAVPSSRSLAQTCPSPG